MADYDGDGLADLLSGSACCEHASRFYLFRRRPDGSFSPRQEIRLEFPADRFDRVNEFPPSGLKARVAVTDWNGDGRPDLLAGGNTPALGTVRGPLTGPPAVIVERVWPRGGELLSGITTNLCPADWDGDGREDLIAGGTLKGKRGVYWLRRKGPAGKLAYADPERLIEDALLLDDGSRFTTGVWAADWNADGRTDLIASREEWRRLGAEAVYGVARHRIWVYLRR